MPKAILNRVIRLINAFFIFAPNKRC
jgi:hypothetical protein